ncbi:MAG TPA: protein kinase, partial [Gemmatimonadaceae bacterium]
MTVPQDRVAAAVAGRYAIERELGRGGMATVYLAEDLRHHRKVAIKVLKDDVSASVGATRFLREIEIAAQLQHPHILPLLDSGEAGGVLYYVMPFVEGQSLRQRLAREGELPVGDAVHILIEVADALSYAHAHGVVHRDIKPDNIMLAGRHAVVADFGVARAVSEAIDINTLTSLGVALGTPAYMAPEQAVADPHVDQRADIYALGIVAYELLAGRTPFAGATPQQMLAAHVTEKPDPPSRYRPGLAPALEQAVLRCLEKRAADRHQSADDLLAILEPLATPSGGTSPTEARLPAVSYPGYSRRTAWMILVAVIGALAAFVGWRTTREASLAMTLGRAIHVTSEAGLEIQPDLSPDGKLVAYAAGNFARMRIFIRPVAGGRTIPLSDDSSAVEMWPKWSPDGSQILFLVRGGVSIAPALGGSSRPLVPPSLTSIVRSADWSPDGTQVILTRGDSLLVVPSTGGATRFFAVAHDVHSCTWSPAGDRIACVSQNSTSELPGPNFGNLAPSAILLFPSRGGNGEVVVESASANNSPAWSADGRHLFFLSNRDGPRDIYALSVSRRGTPQRLTTGLEAVSISVSEDGTRFAYAQYDARSNLWTLPIPTRGPVSAEGATALTSGSHVVEAMRVSPDGRWLVYDSNLGGRSHIWRMPVEGGPGEQLTNGPADEFAGDLSPDGAYVAYHSWRNGTRDIEVLPLAGGEARRVTDTPASESYPEWSHDGSSILLVDQFAGFGGSRATGTGSGNSVYVTSRSPEGSWSKPLLIAESAGSPRWSRDSKSIVYVDRWNVPDGRILIAPVPGGPPRVVYEPGPGDLPAERPAWGPDGRIY